MFAVRINTTQPLAVSLRRQTAMKKLLFISAVFLGLAVAHIRTNAQTIIAGGYYYSLAICSDSTVRAWGNNLYGQLGNGTNTSSNVPILVSSLTGITAISIGDNHSLALKNDSTVWAWGYNGVGQLGNGTNTDSNIPVPISSLTGIITIATGAYYHSLAIFNDSTARAWGYNLYGQLGNGTNTDSNVPVPVSALTGITAISGGWRHSLALKNNGTVWAWGINNYGELGNGTNTDSNIPVPVSSLTGIIAISSGEEHSLALKNDGTVWAWGYNLKGRLGNGTNTDSNVPVQVTGLTGVSAIAGCGGHSLALKNDGTVWAWGYNYNGQLGNGNNTDSNVPVQVTGLCYVNAVNEITESFSISVYPNPFSTQTILRTDNLLHNATLTVYNCFGQEVYPSVIRNSDSFVIRRDNLPSGLYFVRLTEENKIIAVDKLVITD